MPVHVSLVVPQGTTAGQQISFVHTDGRNVSLILPAGVVPGQMLHVNVPDDAAAPTPQAQQQQQQQAAGSSQPPPSKRQKSKKELAADDGMSLWPLSERRDPAVWRALSGLSVTHGAWLGRGRDASQGTYDSLRLACAWRIQNPRRSARVEGGTRCMSDELDCLKRKGGVAREVRRDMMTSSTAAALEAQGKLQLRAELNEVLLLHGIPRSSLLTVLANGLNERFSGTHAGAAFGNGAYLAEDLGKADQYVDADANYDPASDLHQRLYGRSYRHPGTALHYALVCRVALGHPIRTKDAGALARSCDDPNERVFPVNVRELAPVPNVAPPMHYHSLIAEKGPGHDRYREFVIFHASDYICPEYLIAYHRENSSAQASL